MNAEASTNGQTGDWRPQHTDAEWRSGGEGPAPEPEDDLYAGQVLL